MPPRAPAAEWIAESDMLTVVERGWECRAEWVRAGNQTVARRGGSYGARSEHVLLRQDVAPGDALDALFTCVRRQKWADAFGAPSTQRTYTIRKIEARANIISMTDPFMTYASLERDG